MNRLDSRTVLGPSSTDPELPILEDLPSRWQHPGVTHEQRAALVREVFRKIKIDGKEIVSIGPDPPGIHTYFAAVVSGQKLEYCAVKPAPATDTQILLDLGVTVTGVDDWVIKLADAAQ